MGQPGMGGSVPAVHRSAEDEAFHSRLSGSITSRWFGDSSFGLSDRQIVSLSTEGKNDRDKTVHQSIHSGRRESGPLRSARRWSKDSHFGISDDQLAALSAGQALEEKRTPFRARLDSGTPRENTRNTDSNFGLSDSQLGAFHEVMKPHMNKLPTIRCQAPEPCTAEVGNEEWGPSCRQPCVQDGCAQGRREPRMSDIGVAYPRAYSAATLVQDPLGPPGALLPVEDSAPVAKEDKRTCMAGGHKFRASCDVEFCSDTEDDSKSELRFDPRKKYDKMQTVDRLL